jgi:hypothetical protein
MSKKRTGVDKMRAAQVVVRDHPLTAKSPVVKAQPVLAPIEPRPKPTRRGCEHTDHKRLPDGSYVQLRYDAFAQQWTGQMTVPTSQGGVNFREKRATVFNVLTRLDQSYRRWLALQKGPEDGTTGA